MDLGGELSDALFKPGCATRPLPPTTPADSHSATPMRERATHVLQLAEENKKLADELRAMDERLKEAERRAEALKAKLVKDAGA
jgi:hypothetical protein